MSFNLFPAASPGAAGPGRRGPRLFAGASLRRSLRPILAAALCLTMLFLAGCRRYNSPPELVGMWQTDDKRYTGKFLQFDDKFVITGLGEDQFPKVQRISGMKMSAMGIMHQYEFELRDEDGNRDRLSLQYLPNDGGQIELSNPKRVIWKKVTPPPAE